MKDLNVEKKLLKKKGVLNSDWHYNGFKGFTL